VKVELFLTVGKGQGKNFPPSLEGMRRVGGKQLIYYNFESHKRGGGGEKSHSFSGSGG